MDTPYLFPSHDGLQPVDIRRPWKEALETAQISDFCFHDLRHTCASNLAMTGATSSDIAAVLGHRTLDMVKRYTHLTPNHIQSVTERMTNKVFPYEAI